MIKYIISGGQTGADIAGLDAAIANKIAIGGWAPNGWQQKNGPNLELRDKYKLREHSGGYKERTWENIKVSTGTIRCCVDFYSPGEICTLNGIKKFNKPYFDVYLPNPASHKDLLIWVLRYNIQILNVAGNTQGTRDLDIYGMTFRYISRFLKYIKSIQS